MTKPVTLLSFALLPLFASTAATAQSGDSTQRESLAVTVYNNNLGVVRDVRRFDVDRGFGEVRMRDVPTQIDPTTVKITSRDHPKDVEVIEQNYEYDLVSQQKLLEKYIDKPISVVDDKGVTITGILLSTEGDKLTLSTTNGITMLPTLARYTVQVPQLPSGLITKPTLVWKLNADRTYSREPFEVLYQTGGMSWHAEYIAALNADDNLLDLSGWVSIENTSGANFPNAKLKLVAGDLHRDVPAPMPYARAGVSDQAMMVKQQFQERGMFEYHLYDLQRPATIMNNEVKQVSLLSATGVHAEKHYTYSGGKNVDVTILFQNDEKNNLGMPLPMGTVRVMKRDKDGSLEFVGEDHIEHTPRDEKITLKVGEAFDLTGEQVVTNQRSFGQNSSEETVEVTLKNHKDEAVTIDVVENLGTNWEITQSSPTYEKRNAYTVVFHVPVKARGEQKVTYTVMHRY